MTFKVQAEISPDRFAMRLDIVAMSTRLVKMDQLKVVDAARGDHEVETPNLHQAQERLKIQLIEGEVVVWPVSYPFPLQAKDRLALLIAEPIVYIEEEQEAIRQGLLAAHPGDPHYKPPTPVKPAKTDDMEALLQAIIKDVMTESDLKMLRDSYMIDGRANVALMESDAFLWPEWVEPWLPGNWRRQDPPDSFERRRVLGIRIDRFQLDPKHKEHGINVILLNVGRHPGIYDYYSLSYQVRREGKRLALERTDKFIP